MTSYCFFLSSFICLNAVIQMGLRAYMRRGTGYGEANRRQSVLVAICTCTSTCFDDDTEYQFTRVNNRCMLLLTWVRIEGGHINQMSCIPSVRSIVCWTRTKYALSWTSCICRGSYDMKLLHNNFFFCSNWSMINDWRKGILKKRAYIILRSLLDLWLHACSCHIYNGSLPL